MEETPRKQYYPIPGGIKRLVAKTKGCLATDRITVDGCKVGYMYREEPNEDYEDSGWVFMSGDESEAYLDDIGNSGMFSTNDIANYDPEILPYLEAPVGSAYYRGEDGKFYKE